MIRVLIVDDSALMCEFLATGLNSDPEIEVVGTATDPFNAWAGILTLKPDVMTLDAEMPKMDGVEFLHQLMPQFPIPVIMVSAPTERGRKITLEAFECGAVDFVTKPGSNVANGLQVMMEQLVKKVKVASTADAGRWKSGPCGRPGPARPVRYLADRTNRVIAIGASTGGTEAIREVITRFPSVTPWA